MTQTEKGFKTYKVTTIEDVKNGMINYFPHSNGDIKSGTISHIFSVISCGRICLFSYNGSTIQFEPMQFEPLFLTNKNK
jgi:hypothetical protein